MSILYKPDQDLTRLERILNFDIDSVTPGFLMLSPASTGQVWILSSIIATPYILWLLIKKRRFGWIIFFVLTVLIPWVLVPLFLTGLEFGFIFYGIPLILHYIFLFLLKHTYRNWKEPLIIDKRTGTVYRK